MNGLVVKGETKLSQYKLVGHVKLGCIEGHAQIKTRLDRRTKHELVKLHTGQGKMRNVRAEQKHCVKKKCYGYKRISREIAKNQRERKDIET